MISNLNVDKIGNLMILLSERLPNLYLTKLLKLLYIIDETAVAESGAPVTWLDYKVWEKGPVATAIYYDIVGKNQIFKNYIKAETKELTLKKKSKPSKKIEAVAPFDDSEFSDYELELIDNVVREFGAKNSDELIDFLHKENSLWHEAVIENGLSEQFLLEKTTDISIDLTKRLRNPFQQDIYNSVKEMLEL